MKELIVKFSVLFRDLHNNQLTTLPGGIFDALSNIQGL
jgi:hypothetical protein